MTPREWAFTLANATSPAFVEPATDALVAMLPLLGDVPDWAFCPQSIVAVCAAPRRQSVPALDEIRSGLEGWMRENRSKYVALANPHPRALSSQQAAHVACCDQRLSDGGDPGVVLSILNQISGKAAVAEILRDRPGLVGMCRQRGWLDEVIPPTDAQRDAVREMVTGARGA